MVTKIKLFIYGCLIAVSLISPPGVFRLEIIEFSDFLIFVLSIALFYENLKSKKFKISTLKESNNLIWLTTLTTLIIALFIYGVNALTLRILFYCVLGYLLSVYIIEIKLEELKFFIIPFFFVTILNLLAVIFEISLIDNSVGWISFYYENPSLFNRGRLSGFQGSGPNVAGGVLTILTFFYIHFYYNLKHKIFLIFTFVNVVLIFFTFSRGSYVALLLGAFLVIFSLYGNLKNSIITILSIIILGLGFLYFVDSKTLLKESDRSLLTNIAIENISIISEIGPGNYVEKIYKDYLLSINPDILEENLGINLNKVELGITPEEYRNSEINFFIGTSGGGFEILTQSKLIPECSEDRITCQHVRVKGSLLIDFFATIYNVEVEDIESVLSDSQCKLSTEYNITRGQYFCITDEIQKKVSFFENPTTIPSDLLIVECEQSGEIKCENRELAIGELAVIVEALSIKSQIVPLSNYTKNCSECKFRNAEGYIKLKYNKREGILPRSVISFYSSSDNIHWDIIGYPRTTGEVINFNQNNSYIEIGGHADGQSFGNTFLDAIVYEYIFISKDKTQKIIFNEQNLNKDYFVFRPNSEKLYTSKITFENNGIKLFRPNKYWIAVDNNFNFQDDFEIVLKIAFPEIPWERQTLISQTSIFEQQTQSWKFEIDDGRPFFYWANESGVFNSVNVLGDKSLRSGVFVQKKGKISNSSPPIIDPSFLSQLTTAHNGYLTFSVEYGLLISFIFYALIFYFIVLNYLESSKKDIFIFVSCLMMMIQNFTNDMVYSPDIFVLFLIAYSFMVQSIKSSEDINS